MKLTTKHHYPARKKVKPTNPQWMGEHALGQKPRGAQSSPARSGL